MKAFLGEKVVDKHGIPVGTLECFWGATPDHATFYGVKPLRHSVVRVVPAWHSAIDALQPSLQLGFDAYTVESGPGWDCALELDAFLQEKVNIHFGLSGAVLHLHLVHYARESTPG